MRYFLLAVKWNKDFPCENVFLKLETSDSPSLKYIRSCIADNFMVADVIIQMFQELSRADFDMLSPDSMITEIK